MCQFMPTQRSESDAMFTSLICTSVSFRLRQEKEISSMLGHYMTSLRILVSPGIVLLLLVGTLSHLAPRICAKMQEFMARKQTIVCVPPVHQSSLITGKLHHTDGIRSAPFEPRRRYENGTYERQPFDRNGTRDPRQQKRPPSFFSVLCRTTTVRVEL